MKQLNPAHHLTLVTLYTTQVTAAAAITGGAPADLAASDGAGGTAVQGSAPAVTAEAAAAAAAQLLQAAAGPSERAQVLAKVREDPYAAMLAARVALATSDRCGSKGAGFRVSPGSHICLPYLERVALQTSDRWASITLSKVIWCLLQQHCDRCDLIMPCKVRSTLKNKGQIYIKGAAAASLSSLMSGPKDPAQVCWHCCSVVDHACCDSLDGGATDLRQVWVHGSRNGIAHVPTYLLRAPSDAFQQPFCVVPHGDATLVVTLSRLMKL